MAKITVTTKDELAKVIIDRIGEKKMVKPEILQDITMFTKISSLNIDSVAIGDLMLWLRKKLKFKVSTKELNTLQENADAVMQDLIDFIAEKIELA